MRVKWIGIARQGVCGSILALFHSEENAEGATQHDLIKASLGTLQHQFLALAATT